MIQTTVRVIKAMIIIIKDFRFLTPLRLLHSQSRQIVKNYLISHRLKDYSKELKELINTFALKERLQGSPKFEEAPTFTIFHDILRFFS